MAGFVLLRSPLVGPSTWKWVAEELRNLGNDVDVPVISPSSTSQGCGVGAQLQAKLFGRAGGDRTNDRGIMRWTNLVGMVRWHRIHTDLKGISSGEVG